MSLIKTADEILKVVKACQILVEVKNILFQAIKPGVSLKDLDSIAFKEIIKRGGKPAFLGYQGFPGIICASLNEELIHGIPDERILQDRDLISIDVGVIYQGYYSDSAFTKSVGPTYDAENEKLIQVAKNAFYAGLNAIKPGARVGDISSAIGKYIKKNNLYTPSNFSGHGIGKNLHELPYVFNDGQAKTGPLLKDGMIICIEPMILQHSKSTYTKSDNWTVVSKSNKKASHYEHTILIQNGYPIVLTEGID